MTTYNLSLVSTDSIEENIEPLLGHKHLWRVQHEGQVIAYCVERSFAERVTQMDFRPAVIPTGHLFAYPSVEAAVAMCVGMINQSLKRTESN